MCEITTAGGEGLRNLIESTGLFSTHALHLRGFHDGSAIASALLVKELEDLRIRL